MKITFSDLIKRIFINVYSLVLLISMLFFIVLYQIEKAISEEISYKEFYANSTIANSSISTALNNMDSAISLISSEISRVSQIDSSSFNPVQLMQTKASSYISELPVDKVYIFFLNSDNSFSKSYTLVKKSTLWINEPPSPSNEKFVFSSMWTDYTIHKGKFLGNLFFETNKTVYSRAISSNGKVTAIIGFIFDNSFFDSIIFDSFKNQNLAFTIYNSFAIPIRISDNYSSMTLNQHREPLFNISLKGHKDFSLTIVTHQKNYSNSAFYFLTAVFIFILAAVFILYIYIYKKNYEKTIKKMILSLETASNGNFSVKFNTLSHGILGILEKNFNTFMHSMNKIHSELIISKVHAEYSNSCKTEFISNITEKIKNPLAMLTSVSESLKNSILNDSQHAQLNVVTTSAHELNKLFNEIIDYIKLETGDKEIKLSKTNIKKLVLKLTNFYSINAELKNISLVSYCDKNIPDILWCDESKLSIALTNLIDNAIKYTHEGSVTITGIIIDSSHDFCTLNFSISDTGIGIPEHSLEHFLNKFSVNSKLDFNKDIAGLGLYITNKTLELIGSKLEVTSNETSGSRFFFTLKLKKSASAADFENIIDNNRAVPIESFINLVFYNKRVVVVDESFSNLDIIGSYLDRVSAIPIKCSTGSDAIEIFENGDVDLILLDCNMSGLSCFEIARIIRIKEVLLNKNTPIILMISEESVFERELLETNGIDDSIIKPFNFDELFAIMEKWLNK